MIRSIQARSSGRPEVLTGLFEHSLVYLVKPTTAELDEVAEAFDLNVNTLRDALDPYEAPRFEADNGATYVFVRYPVLLTGERSTIPVLVAITRENIVMVAQEELPFIDRFSSGSVPFDPTQRTDLFLKILAEINHQYTQGLTSIQRAVNRRKQSINTITEQDIVEITTSEMALNDYMDALVPQASALMKLLSGRIIELDATSKEQIDDLVLSVNQHSELTRSLLKTTADIRSAYSAISTQRLNVVIQRLTALTILVTVPNVITGFYGMNILLPFADNPHAATYVLASLAVIVLSVALVLVRSRWL